MKNNILSPYDCKYLFSYSCIRKVEDVRDVTGKKNRSAFDEIVVLYLMYPCFLDLIIK